MLDCGHLVKPQDLWSKESHFVWYKTSLYSTTCLLELQAMMCAIIGGPKFSPYRESWILWCVRSWILLLTKGCVIMIWSKFSCLLYRELDSLMCAIMVWHKFSLAYLQRAGFFHVHRRLLHRDEQNMVVSSHTEYDRRSGTLYCCSCTPSSHLHLSPSLLPQSRSLSQQTCQSGEGKKLLSTVLKSATTQDTQKSLLPGKGQS